jgi:Transglycosylase SLT domain
MTTQPTNSMRHHELAGSHRRPIDALRLRPAIGTLLAALAVFAFAPAAAGASEQTSSTGTTTAPETSPPSATTTNTPAPEAPATTPATTPAATTTETVPAPAPAPASPSGASGEAETPQVRAQHAQGSTTGGSATAHAHAKSQGAAGGGSANKQTEANGGSSTAAAPGKHRAPGVGGFRSLTPPLPLTLGSPISGVSSFFIESFQVPPFLLPIYQAAGTAYGIPWQVLAAINEVETDYGRDLSVSSAGAEGWMQFLPAEWAQYGVDANGDGFKDPYNPADAIFTAARYLKAAGGDAEIRGAVFSYNHSQAYVESVMLRAQLLGGTPAQLLGAVTGLTEARFPVHAPSHYSDGFATVPSSGPSTTGAPRTLVGTTIYSQPGAPVIAVQDGEITESGVTPSLGRYVTLRDAYGNTYTYAELGSVATLYPVLEPHEHTAVSARIAASGASREPAPSGPASAGAQSRSPLSEGGTVSLLALGAAATLESPPVAPATSPAASTLAAPAKPAKTPRKFRAGADEVYLHQLSVGVQVLAGTVLGHIGPGTSATGSTGTGAAGVDESHMLFQIRPAGVGAPLIDPKPILDGWVQLENTSVFRAKGENPFLGNSPTVGQVLLETKEQLEQQVLSDPGIHLPACGRQDVQTGQVDRRVLATLEFLSVSGLHPTVSSLRCSHVAPADAANAAETAAGDTVAITAINGIAIAGHEGPGSIAEIAIHKLSTLQGTIKPSEISSLESYPGIANTVAAPGQGKAIRVEFAPLQGGAAAGKARAAGAFDSGLTSGQWVQLIARLGEIPDPKVASGPSAAAIPDKPGAAADAPSSGATATPSTGSSGAQTGGEG